MTNKAFYANVINGIMNDEMIEKAQALLAREEKVAAGHKAYAEKRKAEKHEADAALVAEAVASLTEEAMTATEVGELIGVKAQKATVLLKRAVEAGQANRAEIKRKGRKVWGYTVA